MRERSEYAANVALARVSVVIGKQFYTPAPVRVKQYWIKDKQDRIVVRGATVAMAVLAFLFSSNII